MLQQEKSATPTEAARATAKGLHGRSSAMRARWAVAVLGAGVISGLRFLV